MIDRWGWGLVGVCWLGISAALMQTTQGLYEDHAQIAAVRQHIPQGVHYLTKWTIWWQVQHGEPDPRWLRAVNIGIAGLVSLLVGRLAFQLGWSAWMATGMMAMHRLIVEPVALLSGRADLLATGGVVLACLFATRPWTHWTVVAIGVSLIGAVACKETAFVGLALVPLTTLMHRRQRPWPLIVVSAILLILTIAWIGRGSVTTNLMPMTTWMLLQATAAMRLITLAIVPIGLSQTIDYDYDALSHGTQMLAAFSLCGVTLLALLEWRHWPPAAFAMLWVLIVILPRVIVQTPHSYFNEHQFYLAMVGVALVSAASWTALKGED